MSKFPISVSELPKEISRDKLGGKEVYVQPETGDRITGVMSSNGKKVKVNGQLEMSPTNFVKMAYCKISSAEVYKKIILVDRQISIHDFINSTLENIPEGEEVAKLRKRLEGKSIENVYREHVERMGEKKSGFSFRACRHDEFKNEGLRPEIDREFDLDNTEGECFNMFRDMNTHIGSPRKKGKSFISSSLDITGPIWYSAYGLFPIVRIAFSPEDGVRAWDFSDGELSDQVLCKVKKDYAHGAQHVIFHEPIPAHMVKQVQCTREVLGGGPVDSFGMEFPSHLNPTLDTLEKLEGSTQPVKVYIEGIPYVMKHGGRQEIKQSNDKSDFQMSAEYFANLAYHKAGIAVPSSAVYSVKITIGGVTFNTHILLNEYIEGEAINAEIAQSKATEIGEGFLYDCLLENYDVVGPKYSNIVLQVQGGKKVVRIDNGAVFEFGPKGNIRSMYNSIKHIYTEMISGNGKPAHFCRSKCYGNVNSRVITKARSNLEKWVADIEATKCSSDQTSITDIPQWAKYVKILRARIEEVVSMTDEEIKGILSIARGSAGDSPATPDAAAGREPGNPAAGDREPEDSGAVGGAQQADIDELLEGVENINLN